MLATGRYRSNHASSTAMLSEHRPWELFQSVFQRLYQYCSAELKLAARDHV